MILSKNKVGYNFIETLNRTLNSLIENNENTFAMHAAMVFPHLLLCKTKSEIDGSLSKTIARRLKHWQDGDLDGLYNEGKALQMRLLKGSRRKIETEAQQFNKLMNTGKISSAIAKLTDTSKGVLSLDEIVKGKTVEQTLIEKHPPSEPINENYITPVSNETIPFHPSIFDQINSQHIKKAAMRTHGSHGPSGLDANEWRRILTHFVQQSVEISKTIAKIAKKLATEELNPELMEPYNACRLITLDKNPGVRPIGIGEVMRRIIGRTIIKCLKNELMSLGSNYQLCLGQKCGIEYAIHTLRDQYSKTSANAVLLIDAENAFNSLNRKLALKNIKITCPSLLTAIKNSYSNPSKLFVNKKTIYSQEGTTQGDPLAMAMYGLAIIPLIKLLSVDDVTQKWYADDGNAVGKLSNLRTVLDKIVSLGKFFGYHVKASKCQLTVKDEKLGEAQKIFANTGITIKAGARVLGSVIGTESECKKFLEFQQNEQIKILKKLTKIAKTSPQNVYACYTKGVQEKLSFLARTTPNTVENLEICENIIKEQLLPNLVGKDTLNPQFREIFSLPLKMGGLNIKLPSDHESYLEWSKETSLILESQDPITAVTQQQKKYVRKSNNWKLIEQIEKRQNSLTP